MGIAYGILGFTAATILAWVFVRWKVYPFLSWALFVIADFLAVVVGNKKYQKKALEIRSLVELGNIFVTCPPEQKSRKVVEWLVYRTQLTKVGEDYARIEVWINSTNLLLEAHPDLNDNLMFIIEGHFEKLDVRKLTILLIDVFKQYFDLKDKLSSDYFKQLIFGLNKALLLLRSGGVKESNLKEIYKTLFRVYRLTQSYASLQKNKHLTEKEFYEKIAVLLTRLSA